MNSIIFCAIYAGIFWKSKDRWATFCAMGWGFLGGISATIVALLAVVILNGPLHLGYDLNKVGTLFEALAVKMGWLCAAIAGVRHLYRARKAEAAEK